MKRVVKSESESRLAHQERTKIKDLSTKSIVLA
jgi:hypothetical protein